MRRFLALSIVTISFALHSCSGAPAKDETPAPTMRAENSKTIHAIHANDSERIRMNIDGASHSIMNSSEVDIIRELNHAGCLIEHIEVDKRRQSMTVSCADTGTPARTGFIDSKL